MDNIYYKSGYKYQLAHSYWIDTHIFPNKDFNHDFLIIEKDGHLQILEGYAWDGPSGPTIDTKTFMRGSLVHDALYQLMALGVIDKSMRFAADALLKKICLEDDMNPFRAWYVEKAVNVFGGIYLNRKEKKLEVAP